MKHTLTLYRQARQQGQEGLRCRVVSERTLSGEEECAFCSCGQRRNTSLTLAVVMATSTSVYYIHSILREGFAIRGVENIAGGMLGRAVVSYLQSFLDSAATHFTFATKLMAFNLYERSGSLNRDCVCLWRCDIVTQVGRFHKELLPVNRTFQFLRMYQNGSASETSDARFSIVL